MKVAVRDDFSKALPLMGQVLRNGADLASEYPLIFSREASGRVVVASEAGEVLSTCALLERDLLYPGGSVRVGLIGSVSTAKEARGRGLASAVLRCAEEELSSRGCLLSMLWADSAEFYSARGYAPVGSERDFALRRDLARALPKPTRVREATREDFTKLHELYTTHSLRVDRSRSESALLYATPAMRILVQDSDEGPIAYACLGRGKDLAGVIHEWAGEPEGVLACTRLFLEQELEPRSSGSLFLMSPDSAHPVTERLVDLGAPSAAGILAMGKLLDPVAALREVAQS